ncbi:hypothetical protein FGIG_01031 [Fasciola gigantica]|uniref:CUB domain-containing protein n=1 Tax=Fasciola gigantica TaxID=46835 RepID=A0A504Z0V3_FASGI|nr:hypothetical protein FGIG_01031 [Fasciola gigantica]
MYSSVLIIFLAFIVLEANALVRYDICGEETLYATRKEGAFAFVVAGGDTIPNNIQCKWKITPATEEDSDKSILVYLKPTSESDPNQCVKVHKPTTKSEDVICAKLGLNLFESDEQTVTVHFPGKNTSQQLKLFNFYYKLGNSKKSNCGPALLTAEDAIKHLQVPIASNCSWSLWANRSEPIVIYTKKAEMMQESNHCVEVTRAGSQFHEALCTATEDMVASKNQPFTITYTSPYSVQNSVGTFRVYYRMQNCGPFHFYASDEDQAISVYTAPGDIPDRHVCKWIVFANNEKPLEISIEQNQIPNQCVKVRCMETDVICGGTGKNVAKCALEEVHIEFPAFRNSPIAKNFRVIYKSVKEEEVSDTDKCGTVQISPGSEKYMFNVSNGSETIPQGQNCTWSFTDSTDKPIRISLETVGTNTENQCVNVKCSDDQTENELCARPGNNSFTCTTKPVIVLYPAKSSVGNVKNFQITYQIDIHAEDAFSDPTISAESTKANSSSLLLVVIMMTIFSPME